MRAQAGVCGRFLLTSGAPCRLRLRKCLPETLERRHVSREQHSASVPKALLIQILNHIAEDIPNRPSPFMKRITLLEASSSLRSQTSRKEPGLASWFRTSPSRGPCMKVTSKGEGSDTHFAAEHGTDWETRPYSASNLASSVLS